MLPTGHNVRAANAAWNVVSSFLVECQFSTIPVLNRPRIARVGVDVAPEHLYRIRAHLHHLLLQEPLDVLSAGRLCQAAGVGIKALGSAATVSPPRAVQI